MIREDLHVILSPYGYPPESVSYTPKTYFTLRALEGEPLREWDGKTIGEMPGMWSPDYPITISLKNPWSDAGHSFLNFEIINTFGHPYFQREIVVHLLAGQL